MKLRLLFITLALIFLPATAAAEVDVQNQLNCLDFSLGRDRTAADANCGDLANARPGSVTNTQNALFDMLDNLIARLPFYLTIVAFFALLFSGGMYIFALGDATKMEQAKKNITWVAIGMIAMALIGISIRVIYSVSQKTTGYMNSASDVEGLTR